MSILKQQNIIFMQKTLFDKIWDAHVVKKVEAGPDVLYIDRHLIHEVTSPVAFLGLKNRGLKVFRPEKTTATPDHNVPTINQHLSIKDELSRHQVEMLKMNCIEHDIVYHGLGTEGHGVVHIIGPRDALSGREADRLCVGARAARCGASKGRGGDPLGHRGRMEATLARAGVSLCDTGCRRLKRSRCCDRQRRWPSMLN